MDKRTEWTKLSRILSNFVQFTVLPYGLMMYPLDDTITAIASARSANGLRGVVRLSGSESLSALEILGVSLPEAPLPTESVRRAVHFDAEIALPNVSGREITLPARIYLWADGRSYTGQRASEIHTVGAEPFLEAITETLCRAPGVRLAQPGEFTLRAFLSGRLDLTQAEAVLGTIDAQNPRKLEAALHQLAGGLAVPLQNLRALLFDLLGHLEAGFDFADEDIEFISSSELARNLKNATETIASILQKMRTRSGGGVLPRVTLYGAPNIGKSALFNTLTGAENSLVFDRPGTTRDYLSATLTLGNYSCLLVDTAGDFREIQDENAPKTEENASYLNEKSQELARSQKELADVPLFCFDAVEFTQARQEALRIFGEKTEDGLLLLTRCDLLTAERRADFEKSLLTGTAPALRRKIVWTSSRTGTGIEELRARLTETLADRAGDESDVVASTQSRCRASLQLALESLERAETLCGTEFQELIATELRVALEQIGFMVGAIYTEDLLDSIFSRFCVGK